MLTFYHGSSKLFDEFDLSHATEGDGKVKFGFGVYVTSNFETARHYAFCGAGKDALEHYVYTVEVPEINSDNCLYYKKPVSQKIIDVVSSKMNLKIPEKVCADGKDFRKWIALTISGDKRITVENEKLASEFLAKTGVIATAWPYNWRNPDWPLNIAFFNSDYVKIIKRELVENT